LSEIIAEAFVAIRPDTSRFQAELQAGVTAAVAAVKPPPITVPVVVPTAAAATATAAAGAARTASAANTQLAQSTAQAGKAFATSAEQANLWRGALIGISRVTPVTVFGLGKIGTVAIAASLALRQSFLATAQLEEELNVFQAVTQATDDQMRRVAEAARQLGADISLPATTAVDAATALTELAKAGLSIEDSLGAVRGTLQLAAAAELSAGEAAEFVATQLNAFGLAGTDAVRVADLLAGASIAAQGSIRDFGFAFAQVSAVANRPASRSSRRRHS
jgi:hypothetical protein